MKMMKYASVALAVALGLSLHASADDDHGRDHRWKDKNTAPEMDPGMAMTALSLVGGTLLVVRTRRAKK